MTLTQTYSSSEQSADQPEKAKQFYYPYASYLASNARELREVGIDINEWHAPSIDLDEIFNTAKGPVLEIGGPTTGGFYFLDIRSLPSRPVMGNLTQEAYDAEGFLIEGVELLIDGRNLPFSDNSLGIVLSGHLPKYDRDHKVIGPLTKKDFDDQIYNLAIVHAKKSLEHVARTRVVDTKALEDSLRLAVAYEVYDKLIPGGLYLTDADILEVKAYQAIGYELIASFDEATLVNITGDMESYLSVVLRKPETTQ